MTHSTWYLLSIGTSSGRTFECAIGSPFLSRRSATDWIGEDVIEAGRFIPQAVLRAMRRRATQDPNAPIRRLLGGRREVVVINDEAHHVYGETRTRKGED